MSSMCYSDSDSNNDSDGNKGNSNGDGKSESYKGDSECECHRGGSECDNDNDVYTFLDNSSL